MTSGIATLNDRVRSAEATVQAPHTDSAFGKVPIVTLGFWIIKIAATTLGETGGDAVTMSLDLGYLVGTLIFSLAFAAALAFQLKATRFRPFLYWSVVIASTTVGTTLADFATRSIGVGYIGGSLILATLLLTSLVLWYLSMGSVAVSRVVTPKGEIFYWATILLSQTLGTALGDFAADDGGLGYGGGALVFGAALAVTALLYVLTDVSRVALFWAAFILTRPLGATLGDFLDKPLAHGGLALDRFHASIVLIVFIVACILLIPQKPLASSGPPKGTA